MLSVKDGVKVNGLRPEILLAIIIANEVYSKNDLNLVITECTGGKHGHGSLHYVGNAVDLRTRNINTETVYDISNQIRHSLGVQYDVVAESDHIHIEFQPK